MKNIFLNKDARPYLIVSSIIAIIFLFIVPVFFSYVYFIFLPNLESQPTRYFDYEFLKNGGFNLSLDYLRAVSWISITIPPILFLITASILVGYLFLKHRAKENLKKTLKLLILGFICISLIELGFLYTVWYKVIEWYSGYSRGCLYPSADGFEDVKVLDFIILDDGRMGFSLSTPLGGKIILTDIQAQVDKNILCTTKESISTTLTDEAKSVWLSCTNMNNLKPGDCIKSSVTISYTNNGEERKTVGKITAFLESEV